MNELHKLYSQDDGGDNVNRFDYQFSYSIFRFLSRNADFLGIELFSDATLFYKKNIEIYQIKTKNPSDKGTTSITDSAKKALIKFANTPKMIDEFKITNFLVNTELYKFNKTITTDELPFPKEFHSMVYKKTPVFNVKNIPYFVLGKPYVPTNEGIYKDDSVELIEKLYSTNYSIAAQLYERLRQVCNILASQEKSKIALFKDIKSLTNNTTLSKKDILDGKEIIENFDDHTDRIIPIFSLLDKKTLDKIKHYLSRYIRLTDFISTLKQNGIKNFDKKRLEEEW